MVRHLLFYSPLELITVHASMVNVRTFVASIACSSCNCRCFHKQQMIRNKKAININVTTRKTSGSVSAREKCDNPECNESGCVTSIFAIFRNIL